MVTRSVISTWSREASLAPDGRRQEMTQVTAVCLGACLAVSAFAQTQTAAFDVASIRRAAPGSEQDRKIRLHPVRTAPGSVAMRNVDVGLAIAWAYDVAPFQLAGQSLPDARYDIVAKASGPATDDEMRAMMQSLLESRFGLKAHREEKEMAGMALLVAQGGAKLKAAEDQGESAFDPVPGKKIIHFGRMSMAEFARLLSDPMHKPVVDLTNLKGSFDFTLDGTKYEAAPGERDDDLYMIMRALQDEVGLRIEPRKVTLNMVVVDHVEKNPTEN
jgi:uncharacterized protein (TIGR03435 family)